MVRIIDPNPAPEVVKQVLCRNCGVKLEYVPRDVQTGFNTDYTGCKDSYRYIKCPNCQHEVHV